MNMQRKALVTGAARGIGLEIARQLGRDHDLVLLDIDEQALREAQDSLKGVKGSLTLVRADISREEECQRAWQEACAEGPPLVLVNNAGITRDAMVHKMEEAAFRQVIAINLLASIYLTELAVDAMTGAGFGRVVYLSSRAYLGNVGQANYASSKGGVVGYARSMALRHGPAGITFNCVAPGLIRTRLTDAIPDQIRQKFIDAIPVARIGQPEDIAGEVAWLCSEQAGFITGQVRHVCGGRSYAGPIKG